MAKELSMDTPTLKEKEEMLAAALKNPEVMRALGQAISEEIEKQRLLNYLTRRGYFHEFPS